MPLDDASPQAADYSPQQYIGPNGDSPFEQYSIKNETLVMPDPFTLYFGFGGTANWQRNFQNVLVARIDMCRVLTDRFPTQDEMDAFATISSRGMYYNRIGAPVGFTAYLIRAYTSARKTPVYHAVMPESARTRFPSPRQIVEGLTKFAKMDPSTFRMAMGMTAFRAFFWTIAGKTLSATYATYHDARATIDDPRLANFLREAKQQDPEEVRKRKLKSVSERYRHSQSAKQQQTGEGVAEQGVFAENEQQDGYQSLYNNTPEATTTTTEPQRTYNEPATQQPTKSTNQDPVSDMFDDASPTAPEYQSTDQLRPSNTFQRGAWERIRQQNISGSSPARVEPFRQPSEGWTTQSSSSSNGNGNTGTGRQQEKEQARAEFERMLDEERNMSSDEGSGQSGGWRRW